MVRLLSLSALALFAANAWAQTSTLCNPLNSTCPADPALSATYNTNFTKSTQAWESDFFTIVAGEELVGFDQGVAQLPITQKGQSVTIQTNFYIMWGHVDIVMQAAPGQGIISSFILISDDLDEIDWEFLGGNDTTIENNWYGWGNTSQMNAHWIPFANASEGYHTYSIDWTQERLQWLVDGNVVRTLPYAAAPEYPQTPMQVRFGIWAAGSAGEPQGTIEWAGGLVDWSQAPFIMNVKSLTVTDYTTNVTSYSYGDNSGQYTSIKSITGQSKAYKQIHSPTRWQQAQDTWNGLSTGAKIGIACGVLGALALLALGFSIYCCAQRRSGRLERQAADKEWVRQESELQEYRSKMANGAFALSSMSHGAKF